MSRLDAEENPDAVVFGGPSGRLTLEFEGATLRGGTQEDRWPTATISFDALGLHAAGKFTFFDHDLDPFVRSLSSAHATLSGRAVIESEDGDFSLRVEYLNGGEVNLSGHLQPNLYDASILNYRIETDQSYLASALLVLQTLSK